MKKRVWQFMVAEKITGIPRSRHESREAAERQWAKRNCPRVPHEIKAYSQAYWDHFRG